MHYEKMLGGALVGAAIAAMLVLPLAPTPTLPRKRGKRLMERVATIPSPACGGGLGWGHS